MVIWLLSSTLTAAAVLVWSCNQSISAVSPLVWSTRTMAGSIKLGIFVLPTRVNLVGSIGDCPCLAVRMM